MVEGFVIAERIEPLQASCFGHPEISPRNSIFSVIAQNGLFQADSPGTQNHPAVASIEGEPVVIKHRIGAFGGIDLQTILQSRAIETLVLASSR
jgi:nicotinamidase-related amidase